MDTEKIKLDLRVVLIPSKESKIIYNTNTKLLSIRNSSTEVTDNIKPFHLFSSSLKEILCGDRFICNCSTKHIVDYCPFFNFTKDEHNRKISATTDRVLNGSGKEYRRMSESFIELCVNLFNKHQAIESAAELIFNFGGSSPLEDNCVFNRVEVYDKRYEFNEHLGKKTWGEHERSRVDRGPVMI